MTKKDPLLLATKGPLVAIPIPWAHCPSGCVEWRLVDWTVADDDGRRLPILDDGGGETGAWGSDYAIQGPDGGWRFTDGETCDNENLLAAFKRRIPKH